MFQEFKSVVPQLLNQIGLNQESYAGISALEKELAPYHPYVQVAGVKKNKIYIEVTSPSHFQDIQFRKRDLLQVVHSSMGRDSSGALPEIKIFMKGMSHPDRRERQ